MEEEREMDAFDTIDDERLTTGVCCVCGGA